MVAALQPRTDCRMASARRRLLVCLLTLPYGTTHTVIGGVQTRRIQPAPGLPWVLEADWEATAAKGDGGIKSHDPLSSCYWPAAAALARVVNTLSGNGSYLELGCGTGLLSLVAAAGGARCVMATDISSTSLEYTAAAAAAQGLTAVATSIFDATNLATPMPPADVLLLSDVFVTDALATAFAARVAEALNGRFQLVLVVDPGRSTRETFLAALSAHGVRHGGFVDEDQLVANARSGQCVCLLGTEEGAPLSYCI